MAKKKSEKNVLDYDPLAWLDESETNDSESASSDDEESTTQKKASTKKAASKKSVTKKQARKKPKTLDKQDDNLKAEKSLESDDNEGFGFFADDEPNPEVENKTLDNSETSSDENIEPESEGYGFFDTSTEELTSQAIERDEATNVIKLGAELTIRSVSTCKSLVDENFSNGFDIKLDAGDLQKIDTAGLQLIYSLNKTLEKSSQSIQWESSNLIINNAAKMIGMEDLVDNDGDDGSYGFFNEESDSTSKNETKDEGGFGFF